MFARDLAHPFGGDATNMALTDDLTRLAFSVHENRGVFALLLGSGLSRAAEIPTGWEITLDLVRRVALAQGVDEQPDWAAWYHATYGKEPDYSDLVGDLGQSAAERRAILHGYIEPSPEDRDEGRKQPTRAHEAIADLVRDGFIRVIVTTNFDRLLENALRERGVEPTVVASVDALKGAQPLTHSVCFILKLHGDYLDARIFNTVEELTAYPPEYDALLNHILDEHGLIVSGWSGEWDHALRAAILRAPSRRYSLFWTARGALGAGAAEIVAQRAGVVVPIAGADAFFLSLRESVTTLERTQRRNPRSVDLLIAGTKRYLARPEHRILLDDLVAGEVETLRERLDGLSLKPGGTWSAEEFRSRVSAYEAATEALARMVGVMGRWGDGSETGLVADIIRTLYAQAEEEGSGFSAWLNLRAYPAVLTLTAYGLGLTRARRWRALREVLSSTLKSRHEREPERLVDTLFLQRWKGGGQEVWRNLEGFEKRKTPLSDHLHQLFAEWVRSFQGVVPDYEELFETWEILASFCYLERHAVADLQEALTHSDPLNFVSMPVGRSGWHTQMRERVIKDLQTEPTLGELRTAGLGQGSAEFVPLAVQNLQRIGRNMEW